jgi:hypothetical protein
MDYSGSKMCMRLFNTRIVDLRSFLVITGCLWCCLGQGWGRESIGRVREAVEKLRLGAATCDCVQSIFLFFSFTTNVSCGMIDSVTDVLLLGCNHAFVRQSPWLACDHVAMVDLADSTSVTNDTSSLSMRPSDTSNSTSLVRNIFQFVLILSSANPIHPT